MPLAEHLAQLDVVDQLFIYLTVLNQFLDAVVVVLLRVARIECADRERFPIGTKLVNAQCVILRITEQGVNFRGVHLLGKTLDARIFVVIFA